MGVDWEELERVISDLVVAFVRKVRAEHPGERLYAAAISEFYAESGGRILSPMISVASEEWLASKARTVDETEARRWDAADWPWHFDPTESGNVWVGEVEEQATADNGQNWDRIYDHYLRTVAYACARARETLVADESVHPDFLVVPLDEEFALVPLALSPSQIATHFEFLLSS
ncbi:DUF4303 domain-containing protein [Microbacterium aurugineum]|uniref:DUF4303 domain-containing protein n=1 Tax=Microbacterium aurugineum TaxID=2851642 RepID=UPI0020BF4ADE|nr:DUF4303 domain-containing protein [Microbacterium aurugineum]MCK8476173.1 DUF4303 domain-containing protein [Microbacterium aurugineum]